MTAGGTRAKALADGRRADSARRRQRVIATISRRHRRHRDQRVRYRPRRRGRPDVPLPAPRLARQSPRHPGLPPAGTGRAVTRASLQADLLAAHERALRLTARIRQLEKRLSETLGGQAWRESGLGAPADIDALSQSGPARHRPAAPAGRTRQRTRCRPRRQPGTHGPAQRDSTPLSHHQVHHICGARHQPLSWKNQQVARICPICPPENELLVWLIRICRAPTPVPPAGHLCENATCRSEARSAPAAAIDSEQYSPSDRNLSAQGRRPAGIPADAQHGDGIPGADADNCAAVAAYRLSVQAGNPLSERKLAQMFGRTSRRWARARITEARQSPSGPQAYVRRF